MDGIDGVHRCVGTAVVYPDANVRLSRTLVSRFAPQR